MNLRGASLLILAMTAAASAAAPQSVPIVDLPAATVRTPTTLGGVIGIREVSAGKVLVNDVRRRQLLMYDTTLAVRRVVFDSVDGAPNSYGPIGVPLIPYIGDSSLMADIGAGPSTLLVLDGNGKIAHSLALPTPDAGSFVSEMAATDDRGRLVYVVSGRIHMPAPGTIGPQEVFVDSNPVMRADLDARRVDTIGRLSRNKGEFAQIDHREAKKIVRTVIVNPLPSPDDWAVLTDGSVAFVRGHDYHIDWLRPDGSRSSTPKLPFDWKRVTDDDKKKLIDSTRAAHASQNALAEAARNALPPPPPMMNDGAGGTQRTGGGAGITRSAYDAAGNLWVPLSFEIVDPKDISDYWPAIRKGAVMADRDNRLWILPTTSAQSRSGELIYDVVNANGELYERVRLPVGRQVTGFGKGGVVYLAWGDRTNGFYLERTRLPETLHTP